MTVATLTFGVTDLALEKAQEADSRLAPKSFSVASFIANLFASAAAKVVHTQAHELAVMAVWFKGAKAELAAEREEGQPHAPEKLLDALERTEKHIAKGREKMLGILRKQAQSNGKSEVFLNAVRAYVIAAADFHDSVMSFRWAAMEADADADIAKGRVSGQFTSAEDLLASLKS